MRGSEGSSRKSILIFVRIARWLLTLPARQRAWLTQEALRLPGWFPVPGVENQVIERP